MSLHGAFLSHPLKCQDGGGGENIPGVLVSSPAPKGLEGDSALRQFHSLSENVESAGCVNQSLSAL